VGRLFAVLSLLIAMMSTPHAGLAGAGTWHWLNPLPQGNYVTGVSCPTNGLCFAVGSNGLVLTTRNRGTTWMPIPSGTTDDLSAITCPTSGTCLTLAQHAILTSVNGARTWHWHAFSRWWYFYRLSCPTGGTCFALGSDMRYDCHIPNCRIPAQSLVLIRTVDGGRTWKRLHPGLDPVR